MFYVSSQNDRQTESLSRQSNGRLGALQVRS